LAPKEKRAQKVEEVKNFGPIHNLRSLPDQRGDQRGDVCEVWFRLVQKCEFV